jgi:hypothetical protein
MTVQFRYLDEPTFQFKSRDIGDAMPFRLPLRTVSGRRLTYNTLTGKTPHGSGPQG